MKEIEDILNAIEYMSYVMEVKRNDEILKIELEIIRKKEKFISTDIFEEKERKIGYISFEHFAVDSAKEFSSKLYELYEKQIDSLIIDLRDNPGGNCDELDEIASLFLDSSKVLRIERYRIEEKIVYSDGDKTIDYPIVILANNNTASCAEMLISALKEGCNAILIGEKTYGKGICQSVILTDNYKYKFTILDWVSASGKRVNKIGIEPDIEVHNEGDKDTQLEKAIEYLMK